MKFKIGHENSRTKKEWQPVGRTTDAVIAKIISVANGTDDGYEVDVWRGAKHIGSYKVLTGDVMPIDSQLEYLVAMTLQMENIYE